MATVLITGAATGFGRLTARALAGAGHTVYATMRDPAGRNASRAAALRRDGAPLPGDIRPYELDVLSEESARAAVTAIVAECGGLDVVVHHAGRLVVGPAEAFGVDEFAALFDTNVLGAQRVNRAVLPHLRRRGSGLLVWVGSTTSRGGHPPFMGPYVATKAAFDLLAQTYAFEVVRFGIETTIVVPGAFTRGPRDFADAARPADAATAAAYARYDDVLDGLDGRLLDLAPPDADRALVGEEIARVVGLPTGRRPFRVVVDPSDDGAAEVTEVAERVRTAFARRIGIEDLLPPVVRR